MEQTTQATATEQPRREPSPGPNPSNRKPPKAPAPKGKTAKAKAPAKAKKAKPANGAAKSTDALAVKGKEYHRDTKVKTADGSVSVDSNDKTAKELRGKSLDEVYTIASKLLKEPATQLKAKYKHLNPGMQRMNLGNRIRAAK